MPKVYLELLESSFTFLGPNELLTASEDVEEDETLVGRPRKKPVQWGDAPYELLDFFSSPRGLHVEDNLDFLWVSFNSSLTHHETHELSSSDCEGAFVRVKHHVSLSKDGEGLI